MVLSVASSSALNVCLTPSLGPAVFGCAPVKPDTFPTLSVVALVLGAAVATNALGLTDAADSLTTSFRWVCLSGAIYTQAASVLPQRAALARAKKVEAITAHAVALLALAALCRMGMWCAVAFTR